MTTGTVLYVKITDEPVLVTEVSDRVYVRRSQNTSTNGIVYIDDAFHENELITREEKFKQEMEAVKNELVLREQYAAEYQATKSRVAKPGPSTGGELFN